MKRFRFKRDKTVSYPLIKEARLAREKAEQLPPGEEREGRRADTAAHINEWQTLRGCSRQSRSFGWPLSRKAEQPPAAGEGKWVAGSSKNYSPATPVGPLPMPLPHSSRRNLHWPDRHSYTSQPIKPVQLRVCLDSS